MKNKFFLISFILFSSISKSNEIEFDYLVGKIFQLNGDTLITKIHLNSRSNGFLKTLYLDGFGHYLDKKNKVRGLNPNNINGFEVMIDTVVYTFISKSKEYKNKKKIFFHLLNENSSPVKLYEFYNNEILASSLAIGFVGAYEIAETHYAIEYNNGVNATVVYFPKRKDFRYDKLAFILSDNKNLEKKIEDQVYKYEDMPLIISEYNNWFQKR